MEIIGNFDMLDEQSKHALRDLKDGKETIWRNSEKESSTAIREQTEFKTWWFAPLHRDPGAPFSPADPVKVEAVTSVADAERRLQRFAPFIKELFKEDETLQKSNGIIESPLVRVAAMQRRVEEDLGTPLSGDLYLKCDCDLPISGSIKARGGIYEVLKYAEALAVMYGLLPEDGEQRERTDYRCLLDPACREMFSQHRVCVGSTGNLGLSIGIMGARIGFDVTVHMSVDAKQWKKDLLRKCGARVVEHTGDFSTAVAAGREAALRDPRCHFVDDELSADLFCGYAAGGARLARKLHGEKAPRRLYLPCGVGGGPAGVAFGFIAAESSEERAKTEIIFAEPIAAPAMCLALASKMGDKISVKDIGYFTLFSLFFLFFSFYHLSFFLEFY